MVSAVSAVTANAGQSSGDHTLQLSGSITHAEGSDSGVMNLDIGYGYLLTDKLKVGFIQYLGYSFIDGGDDIWTASTIPYVNYYLSSNDSFQPFLGAFIGASYNEDDVTGTLGPQVGFQSFVNDKTFLLVKYRYEWFFDDLTVNDIDETKSDGTHVGTIGVGFVF